MFHGVYLMIGVLFCVAEHMHCGACSWLRVSLSSSHISRVCWRDCAVSSEEWRD